MFDFGEKCKILQSDTLGRYVVADKKLSPGQVILTEGPTLILPSNDETRCINCLRVTNEICGKCKTFLLCGNCSSHYDFDCNFFGSETFSLLSTNMAAFGIIKCLLLNENPKTSSIFEQLVSLESHKDKRRGTAVWSDYQKTVVEPILSSNILTFLSKVKSSNNEELEEFIQHLCGIIDVNSFEIRAPDDGSMRAIYLNASLLAHDCVANTSIAIDDDYQMKIYTNCDVEEGAMLTYCYTNPLLGTDERRQSLMIGKYFYCKCNRCMDPTELGSHMSSLRCRSCSKGYIVRTATSWQCQECSSTLDDGFVNQILDNARDEILRVKHDILKNEHLIIELSQVFHNNHYLIIDIKQNVAALLRSYLMNPIFRPGKLELDRKTKLCEDILRVLQIIQPGISRLKAIALYEKYSSYAELHRLKFHEEDISESELLEALKDAEIMLRESIRMLLYEPVDSPEGRLTKSMLKELKDLQNDMKILSK